MGFRVQGLGLTVVRRVFFGLECGYGHISMSSTLWVYKGFGLFSGLIRIFGVQGLRASGFVSPRASRVKGIKGFGQSGSNS